jgi:1,2-diacylglycerol 3-alpha-glucosyltransferase
MKILIEGTTYYPAMNGQAVFTTHLAEGLANQGHEVVMITPSDQGHAYSADCRGVRIETTQALNMGVFHPDAYVPLYSRPDVKRVLDEFRPDVVHIHDHYPLSNLVVRMAKARRIKTVGTNHFMPANLAPYVPWLARMKPVFEGTLWTWMLWTYNRLDLVTAPSQTAADLLRRQGLKPTVLPVSCGLDLSRFRPMPEIDRRVMRMRYGLNPDRTLFLFVGRVDDEKRLDVIIEALSLLGRDDVQLGIAGRGAAANKLKEMAEERGLSEQVRFTGFVPDEDLPALINSADVFVMPSEAELLSIATLEAMGCGRPVLLANAVALPELVVDGYNGFRFAAGDARDAARYLAWFADHSDLWAEMGAASLEKVQVHGIDNTVQTYERLYDAVLSGVEFPQTQILLSPGKKARQRDTRSTVLG